MTSSPDTTFLVKRLLILAVMVTALVVAIKVDPASAAPCREFYTDYYEEPELINWCGYKYNACNHIYTDGCQTPYTVVEFGACCGGGGPLCDC